MPLRAGGWGGGLGGVGGEGLGAAWCGRGGVGGDGGGGGGGGGVAEVFFGLFEVDVIQFRRVDFAAHEVVDDRVGGEVEADGKGAEHGDGQVDPEGDEDRAGELCAAEVDAVELVGEGV